MPVTTRNIAFTLTAMLLVTSGALAGDSPADTKLRMGTGDPVAGKEKSALCQGCHGEDGNSASPDFPKLAGLSAAYIQKQIHDFQKGKRKDPVMSDMAATVTENQDLLDISAYFASQKQMKGDSPVVNKAGRLKYLDNNGCVNCHGENGKGIPANPLTPAIGGQHKDYLLKQLKAFKSGSRNNEPSGMMPFLAGMMSDAELDDVASYISGL